MKNPLAISLGLVIIHQRLEYADDNKLNEEKSKLVLANDLGIPLNSYKSIESGEYISKSVVKKLSKSIIIKINFDRLLSYLSILDIIGRKLISEEEYVVQCNSVIKMTENEDLINIIKKSRDIRWPNDHSNTYAKRKIRDSGLFEDVFKYLVEGEFIPRKRTKYYSEFANKEDMHYIHDVQLPAGHWSLKEFEDLWEKNNQIFTIVYSDQSKKSQIGHFKLLPLTKSRVEEYFNNDFKKGTPDCFSEKFRDACGLHIGVVSHSEKYSSGAVLIEMLEHIKMVINMSNISALFTITESKEGLQLANRFGFEIIPNSNRRYLEINTKTLKKFNIDKILHYQ